MSEMIPKAKSGKGSHESQFGKRVDGDFFPLFGQYGEVVGYKYEHGKCWHCKGTAVYRLENGIHVCDSCSTVTNHRRDFSSIHILQTSNRSRKRSNEKLIYDILHTIP